MMKHGNYLLVMLCVAVLLLAGLFVVLPRQQATAAPLDQYGVVIRPLTPPIWSEYAELVGVNEAVSTTVPYGAVYTTTFSASISGELLNYCVRATTDGAGDAAPSAGVLWIFDAFPGNAATSPSAALPATVTAINQIVYYAIDYHGETANQQTACKTLSTFKPDGQYLWWIWEQTDAAPMNPVPGDDQQLEFRFSMMRHS